MRKVLIELIFFNLVPFLLGMIIVTDPSVKKSIFFGWLIVFISIGIGLLSFKISKNKSNKEFMKFYFGGMIIRLLLLLSVIFAALKFIGINPISFLFSLFIFYVINQIIELRYITRSLSKK